LIGAIVLQQFLKALAFLGFLSVWQFSTTAQSATIDECKDAEGGTPKIIVCDEFIQMLEPLDLDKITALETSELSDLQTAYMESAKGYRGLALDSANGTVSDSNKMRVAITQISMALVYSLEWRNRFPEANVGDLSIAEVLFLRSLCLRELKEYQTALDDLNSALRLNPRNQWMLLNKAYNLLLMGRLVESKESFNNAKQIDPDVTNKTWEQFKSIF
jgi:tetratricopeptide (TPR) repeat protein